MVTARREVMTWSIPRFRLSENIVAPKSSDLSESKKSFSHWYTYIISVNNFQFMDKNGICDTSIYGHFHSFSTMAGKKVSHIPLEPGDTIGGETFCVAWENHQKSGPLDSGFSVFSPKYIQISWPILPTIDIICVYIYNMGILNGYYYRLIMVNSYHGQSARYPATK